jgi:hypothetical protein
MAFLIASILIGVNIMTASAARVEANRRNAKKSTGPRTEDGKARSRRNAVTHGMRAEKLILQDEDPLVIEERKGAWRASLLPGDDVEELLVERAVVQTWMQERAWRAQAAKAKASLAQNGVAEAAAEKLQVEDLGRRLFTDRCGPLVFYPSPFLCEHEDFDRDTTTSYVAKGQPEPDRPGALVLRLQATLTGCEWMLSEWAKLKATLDKGQAWLSADKLKAVRLLGKQPLDAIDEEDVAIIFMASFKLGTEKGFWYSEIANELADADVKRFRRCAASRGYESLRPENAANAREALLQLIARATERLTKIAEPHRARAELMAALAPDLVAFDESPAGERLRRYELASGRSLSRALEDLRNHRRSDGSPSAESCPTDAIFEPIEPNDHYENAPNEATWDRRYERNDADWDPQNERNDANWDPQYEPNDATGDPQYAPNEATGDPQYTPTETGGVLQNAPNEATGDPQYTPTETGGVLQNAPNETTGDPQNAPGGATGDPQNAPNEGIEILQNAPNEATGDPQNAPTEPSGVLQNAPNEGIEILQNAPNEATGDPQNTPGGATGDPQNAPNEGIEILQNAPNEATETSGEAKLGSEPPENVMNAGTALPSHPIRFPNEVTSERGLGDQCDQNEAAEALSTRISERKPEPEAGLRNRTATAQRSAEAAMEIRLAWVDAQIRELTRNGCESASSRQRAPARTSKLTKKQRDQQELSELTELVNAAFKPRREVDQRPRRSGSADNGPRTADHGPRIADRGPRTADHGPRTADHGPRTADHGPRTADNGPRTADHGQRTTDHGQRTKDKGQ